MKVAYYVGAFPCLSETFIQREVAALYRSGLALRVFAHRALDRELLQPMGLELLQKTTYLPLHGGVVRGLLRQLRRRPARTLHSLCYFWTFRRALLMPGQSKRDLLVRSLLLAEALEESGVTHLHSPWAFNDAVVALLAAKLLRIPYSVQARASDLYSHKSLNSLDQKLIQAAFIVTNADYNVRTIEERFTGRKSPPIHCVYEGLEVRTLEPVAPREGPLETARLLCVARITEPKGIIHLLQAANLLKRSGWSFRCDIIGSVPASEPGYAEEVRRLHADLGLAEEVRFLGAQPFDRVLERYRWADLCLLAAVEASDGRRDVTPNTLIEALSMGVPVVSTRSGAIPEVVDDGETGLLAPPADPEAFAAAIMSLLDDDALRCRMAARARIVAESRFDIEENICTYLKLFQWQGTGNGDANTADARSAAGDLAHDSSQAERFAAQFSDDR